MGGRCVICGIKHEVPNIYHCHHVFPEDKKSSISQTMKSSFDQIKEEAQKCVLLCSVCHRKVHFVKWLKTQQDNYSLSHP